MTWSPSSCVTAVCSRQRASAARVTPTAPPLPTSLPGLCRPALYVPAHPRARSYKIIGFKFVSNPPPTEATCRKICEMSGVKGFQVGKTKVFLRYFHVDELNLKLKPYPDASKKLQKSAFIGMLRCCLIHTTVAKTFVAKRRLAKYKAQAEKYVCALWGSFASLILLLAAQAPGAVHEQDREGLPRYMRWQLTSST